MGGCAYLAKCFLQKEIFPSCFCRDETKFNHLGFHTQYNFLQCIIQVGVVHHPFLGPGLVGSLLNIKGLCGNFLQLSQLILHLKLLGLCQKDGLFICFLSSISLLSFLLYTLGIALTSLSYVFLILAGLKSRHFLRRKSNE